MKRFIPLFIIALMCASCEPNNPSKDKGDNQPTNPYTWSPVGKAYVCDRSNDKPYEYQAYTHYYEVIEFINEDSVFLYGSTNVDLTPFPDDYIYGKYKLKYPDLTITIGIDPRIFVFTDTITLYSKSWSQTYYLHSN